MPPPVLLELPIFTLFTPVCLECIILLIPSRLTPISPGLDVVAIPLLGASRALAGVLAPDAGTPLDIFQDYKYLL